MGRLNRSIPTGVDPTINDESMRRWMHVARLEDFAGTARNIEQLQSIGVPYDLLLVLWNQLPTVLAELPNADAGFAMLVRYMRASRSPQSVATLFEREPTALPMLLQAMSLGSTVSDTLINDPEAFELLRITDGQPVSKASLIDEVMTEVMAARDDAQVSKTLERFRQREHLRIAFGQFMREVVSDESYRQLSYVAEAVLRSAYARSFREIVAKCGQPIQPNGSLARCCLIALERLGAAQQGYDASLRLLFLAETSGRTDATRIVSNTDFFDRLSNRFLELLTPHANQEAIYRIHFVKPLPVKSESPIVEVAAAFQHYDLRGRTWERQSFVQARPIAGDLSLGATFLQSLQPWIYRRYLSDADIAGLGALQRKLERKLASDDNHRSAVIDDRSAAEDIEEMVLFLQLLHGYEVPEIRVENTFSALDRLAEKHLLRDAERTSLRASYEIFRRAEAGRTLGKSVSTHHLTSAERRQLAECFDATRRDINSRLDESFPENQPTPRETDLVLDPQPMAAWIQGVLAPHRFAEPNAAYKNLVRLSEENISVLSTRRCRYYLSIIAPKLLQSIARTIDPDQTLANLARISESIGGKGVLWELFSSNSATMELMVRLCDRSSYLVNLLTQSPGMIDELMDSLLVDRFPLRDELESTLIEWCRGSDDIDRVLHEFKNSMHLRVGVRDILGKESLVDTHRALSDIADVCLSRIIMDEYWSLAIQFGFPFSFSPNPMKTNYAVIALEKPTGQAPHYHREISLVVLFDHDGITQHKMVGRSDGTTVRHFFEQLAQRVMQRANRVSSYPRLYELDARFGPLGKTGVLAMQLDQFVAYFQDSKATAGERQTLYQARTIAGTHALVTQLNLAIAELMRTIPLTK